MSFEASTSGSATSAHSFTALIPSPPSWRPETASFLRNSHWTTRRRPLPLIFCLLHHPPTLLLHRLQASATLAPPRTPTVAEASVAAEAKAAPTPAPPPVASSSSWPPPSSLPPPPAHGQATTTHGWVPSTCVKGAPVLRWLPSWCPLTCRHNSRRSNRHNSKPYWHSSNSTSSSRPLLLQTPSVSGLPRGSTNLWPASLPGILVPSPPPSARRR
jgi:hypothetical protein